MPTKGDINGDGKFNAADVSAFEQALANPAALGNWSVLGDFNGDGVVTNADLQGMLMALKNGAGGWKITGWAWAGQGPRPAK